MKPKVTKSNQVMVAPESRLVRFAPGSVLRDAVNQP
jgi:nucleoid DNA-binding protein